MPDPAHSVEAPTAPSLEQLQALAKAYGVGVDFWGFYGDLHAVSALTLTKVLAALGVDASTEQACERALADRAAQPWRQLLPPTVVMRENAPTLVRAHVHHGDEVRVDKWFTFGTFKGLEKDECVYRRA